jgi:hypothetical protein
MNLPNMRQGDLVVGAFAHGQTEYDRPFPGACICAACAAMGEDELGYHRHPSADCFQYEG